MLAVARGGAAAVSGFGKAVSGGIESTLAPYTVAGRAMSEGTSISAAETAAAWQGSGLYPGVDRYRNITLKTDTLIVGSTPGQSSYYTTLSGMRRTEMDVVQYYQGVQVAPNLTNPAYDVVRDGLTVYRATQETSAAFSRTLADPQYGKGGLPQVFVPNYSTLEPVGFIPFINKIPGVKP